MYQHILVPIALEHGADDAATLALADRLRAESGRVTLLHCVPPLPDYARAHIPETVLQKSRVETSEKLDTLAATLSPPARIAVSNAHPGPEIVDYAEANDVDCVVMQSHRPGLVDYFLGSTAARVVRHAPCSVHVIR